MLQKESTTEYLNNRFCLNKSAFCAVLKYVIQSENDCNVRIKVLHATELVDKNDLDSLTST